MQDAPVKGPGRKPRVDAARNHALLLEVAKTAFAELGADVSLEEIAKRAGVGIGTLYRHFPNRGAIIEAVYRQEIERLSDAATELAKTSGPVDALRDWMRLFVGHIATKKLIAPALNEIVGGPSDLYAASSVRMKAAITMLVDRAVASGDIRLGLEPLDLLRALAGVANVWGSADWEPGALRLIDILIAGVLVRR
jgi:AcrR family transcriptional regulator